MTTMLVTDPRVTLKEKKFYGDGSKIAFDTEYRLFNNDNAKSVVFKLSHSDGSEWDPQTRWFFKADSGLEFILSNHVPAGAEKAYLNAKLRN